MFDLGHYSKCVLEVELKQLNIATLICRECFLFLAKEYSDSEIKEVLNVIVSSGCEEVYFYGVNARLWEAACDETIYSFDEVTVFTTATLYTLKELTDKLDLEISTNDGTDKDIVLIFDDYKFEVFRNDFLKQMQAAFDNWNEKMSEPIKAFLLV